MYDQNVDPDAGESPEDPQAPDRAEQYRSDVRQNETPEPTEGADTGNVEGRRNDELPTENEPENRAADQGGPMHTPRQMGDTEPQPEGVRDEDNQAADRSGPGNTPRYQGDEPQAS